MAILIIPEFEELSYRRKMHESSRTMAFMHHTEPFPREKWDAFYRYVTEADPAKECYRMIYCRGCCDIVGEVSYERISDTQSAVCRVLIDASKRNSGYGRSGVSLMEEEAAKHGISEFIFEIAADNPASGFLEHIGYTLKEKDGETLKYSRNI